MLIGAQESSQHRLAGYAGEFGWTKSTPTPCSTLPNLGFDVRDVRFVKCRRQGKGAANPQGPGRAAPLATEMLSLCTQRAVLRVALANQPPESSQ